MDDGEFTAPQLLKKQPGETRKLYMDFTNWLSSTSITISSPTVTSETVGGEDSDLTISGVAVSGKKVLFFVSGGTHAKNYSITVTVNTSDSEILQGDGMLRVIGR
jgi:hypothetical protein